MVLRFGAHPHREAGCEQKLKRARLGDDAAAGCDDETLMPAQHIVERLTLGAAESLLAEHVEYLAQGGAAALLDLAVELDEGHAEALGEEPPKRRLAAAAQANERDAPAPGIVGWIAEVLEQKITRFCERRRREPLKELRQQNKIEGRLGAFMHQLGDGKAEGARDAPQQHDRAVTQAGLELRQVALRNF